MTALKRRWAELPSVVRAGFVALSIGLAADLAYHATFGIDAAMGPHRVMGAVPLAIHGIVAAGMALTLIGLASQALTALRHRPARSEPRPEGGR